MHFVCQDLEVMREGSTHYSVTRSGSVAQFRFVFVRIPSPLVSMVLTMYFNISVGFCPEEPDLRLRH